MLRPPNIVHESDVDVLEQTRGERYGMRRSKLGAAAGGRALGCSLYEIPPGRRPWPYHYHCANEEAIYVLEGRGSLRLPSGETPLRAGDYVALPAGAEGAHQVINDSDAPLRFLCLSTMREPDVSVYPDSDKIGVFAGSAPGGSEQNRTLEAFLRLGSKVGYWDAEE